ncbi:hypothetical protein EVAR_18405_1 [Eumeta japonica]|uniref:Uncharacterized protein n=1 Tax=Eumeta variegata TaxID=151549 RepID=A0A4C1UU12_EUMVA|nr:hypothetical protein EVAR_18405_1 [Eumeta japonica]
MKALLRKTFNAPGERNRKRQCESKYVALERMRVVYLLQPNASNALLGRSRCLRGDRPPLRPGTCTIIGIERQIVIVLVAQQIDRRAPCAVTLTSVKIDPEKFPESDTYLCAIRRPSPVFLRVPASKGGAAVRGPLWRQTAPQRGH